MKTEYWRRWLSMKELKKESVSKELEDLLNKESGAWVIAHLESRKVPLIAEVAKIDAELTAIKP